MNDTKPVSRKRKLIYRIILAMIGITVLSAGLSFMRYAILGVDPITCFNIGIAKQLEISFGTWVLIMCFILLIGVFIFDRSKIGFGTVYIMIAAGYTSDFVLSLINKIPFLEIFSLQIRIVTFSLGLLIVFFGSAVYIETNMGLSPYDAIAIIISEKIKRQHWFKWIRIGTDTLCVVGGILTQSDVGIGTLIAVLIGGPLIAFYRKLLTKLSMIKNIQKPIME
jgi:uncharacterized membrane protein YczE